jgi:hypothetical protein
MKKWQKWVCLLVLVLAGGSFAFVGCKGGGDVIPSLFPEETENPAGSSTDSDGAADVAVYTDRDVGVWSGSISDLLEQLDIESGRNRIIIAGSKFIDGDVERDVVVLCEVLGVRFVGDGDWFRGFIRVDDVSEGGIPAANEEAEGDSGKVKTYAAFYIAGFLTAVIVCAFVWRNNKARMENALKYIDERVGDLSNYVDQNGDGRVDSEDLDIFRKRLQSRIGNIYESVKKLIP